MAEEAPEGSRGLTERDVLQATREYYDARPVLGDSWNSEPVGELPDVSAERQRLEGALQTVVRGRDTLEVACGTGEMTRVAAAVAKFRVPGWSDSLSRRQLTDGRSFVIVNNDFDEEELLRVFGPLATDLQMEVGDAWWWVTHSI